MPLSAYLTTTLVTRAFYGARTSPFHAGTRVLASSTGAATLYGVNLPGTLAATRYGSLTKAVNGAYSANVTTLTLPAGFISGPSTADASITAANYLDAIVLVNGVLLERKGQDFTLAANGQFKVASATTVAIYDGSGTYLLGGAKVEVIFPTGIVQHNGAALTANRNTEFNMTDFLSAGVAAVNVFRLPNA